MSICPEPSAPPLDQFHSAPPPYNVVNNDNIHYPVINRGNNNNVHYTLSNRGNNENIHPEQNLYLFLGVINLSGLTPSTRIKCENRFSNLISYLIFISGIIYLMIGFFWPYIKSKYSYQDEYFSIMIKFLKLIGFSQIIAIVSHHWREYYCAFYQISNETNNVRLIIETIYHVFMLVKISAGTAIFLVNNENELKEIISQDLVIYYVFYLAIVLCWIYYIGKFTYHFYIKQLNLITFLRDRFFN